MCGLAMVGHRELQHRGRGVLVRRNPLKGRIRDPSGRPQGANGEAGWAREVGCGPRAWSDGRRAPLLPNLGGTPFARLTGMVERERYPSRYRDCDISVVTERMHDGRWAVVAKVTHETSGAVQITPLPVPERTFDTEEEARDFGYAQALDWIERSVPAA